MTIVQADCELSAPPEVRKEVALLLGNYKANLAGAAISTKATGSWVFTTEVLPTRAK